jgi:hypothetical protein
VSFVDGTGLELICTSNRISRLCRKMHPFPGERNRPDIKGVIMMTLLETESHINPEV